MLYRAAADDYQVPPEHRGVPLLVMGDVYLMSSLDIPQQLPGIIENGLAGGGIAGPDFPGFYELLEAEGLLIPEVPDPPQNDSPSDPEITGEANTGMVSDQTEAGSTGNIEEAVSVTEKMTLAERFAQDKAGNTLSVLVLLGTVLLTIWVGYTFVQPDKKLAHWPDWIVPTLTVIGMIVALYMSYVEITQTEAVCGPVGNCNVVQQSRFAYLFGVMPIGVFGVGGYIAIGFTWLIRSYGPVAWRQLSTISLWLLALFGTLFSMYLTFLEPFVIGASCAWCLTSAVVMALLLWATTVPVVQTWLANDSGQ